MISSKTTYYGMIVAVVLLVLGLFGTTYLANGQLKKQSDKLVDYKLQDQVLSQEQLGLVKAKKDVATYSPLEVIAKTIVPQDKDQATAVREIVNIAAASGIKPTAINFPVSTLGSSVIGTSGAVSAAPTPVVGASAKPSLSQLTPVKGISGVYTLQIIIQNDAASAVPYAKFIDFLSRLEQNRRTAQVSGIVLQPSATDHNLVSFTLTIDEFIKP